MVIEIDKNSLASLLLGLAKYAEEDQDDVVNIAIAIAGCKSLMMEIEDEDGGKEKAS